MRRDLWGPRQLWQLLTMLEREWDRLTSLSGKERNSPPYLGSETENRAVTMPSLLEAVGLLGSRTKQELLPECRLTLFPPGGNQCEILHLLCVCVVVGVGVEITEQVPWTRPCLLFKNKTKHRFLKIQIFYYTSTICLLYKLQETKINKKKRKKSPVIPISRDKSILYTSFCFSFMHRHLLQ